MSDTVKNIIVVLVVMVVCVMVGAIIINVVAPNAMRVVVGGIEAGVKNATGVEVNLDGSNDTLSARGTADYGTANASGTSGFSDDMD